MRASQVGFVLLVLISGCVQQEPANTGSAGHGQGAPTPTYTAPANTAASTPSAAPGQTASAATPATKDDSPPPLTATHTPATKPSAGTSASASKATGTATGSSASSGTSATVQIGKASVSGQLANADTLATAMEGDFKNCYARGLEGDGKAAGTVLLALQVGKDGAVTRADASPIGNVPASVQSCIRSRAETAKFAAPKGGSAIVTFNVTLAPSSSTAAAGTSNELKEVAVSPPGYEHADRIAQYTRAKARECYRDALRTDARAEGKVSVALWLDQKGTVTKVEALRTGTLPDTVTECIRKRAVPARFPAPKLSPTVVTVPIRLALKAK